MYLGVNSVLSSHQQSLEDSATFHKGTAHQISIESLPVFREPIRIIKRIINMGCIKLFYIRSSFWSFAFVNKFHSNAYFLTLRELIQDTIVSRYIGIMFKMIYHVHREKLNLFPHAFALNAVIKSISPHYKTQLIHWLNLLNHTPKPYI